MKKCSFLDAGQETLQAAEMEKEEVVERWGTVIIIDQKKWRVIPDAVVTTNEMTNIVLEVKLKLPSQNFQHTFVRDARLNEEVIRDKSKSL